MAQEREEETSLTDFSYCYILSHFIKKKNCMAECFNPVFVWIFFFFCCSYRKNICQLISMLDQHFGVLKLTFSLQGNALSLVQGSVGWPSCHYTTQAGFVVQRAAALLNLMHCLIEFQEFKMVLHCCAPCSDTLCAAIFSTQAAEALLRLSWLKNTHNTGATFL